MDARNINQVIVADDIARTANVQITDPNGANYIANGEVVIANLLGTVLNTTTAQTAPAIKIVGRAITGDTIYESAPIKGDGLTGYRFQAYDAAAEQLDYIGYNGTSGDLTTDLVADTMYNFRIISTNPGPLYRNCNRSFGWRSVNGTPTSIDVAAGLMKQAGLSLNADTDVSVKIEAISANAGAALGAAADTVVGAQGTKTIVVTDTGSDTSVTAVAAGDFIRLGTGVTDPIYKVVTGITTAGGTITLETPLLENVSLVGTTAEVVTAAGAAAAAAGLKLTGIALEFEAGVWDYRKERFDITLGTNIDGTVTNSVVADHGVGEYEEIAELEFNNRGYYGNKEFTHPIYPVTPLPINAQSDENYDYIIVNWKNEDTTNIEGSTYQQGSVLIAVVDGASQGDTGTLSIAGVLDEFCVTQNGVGSDIIGTI